MPGEQGKASTEYVSEESALAEHETWRRERWEEVSGPRGLAATTVLAKITESEQTIPGVPGHWNPPTAGSVRFTATSEDGVSVAGEPVDGTVELASRTSIEFQDGRFGIVGVYDGMGALTVWDPHAPTLTRLKEIATYPFDPIWIIDGEYVPAPADRVADVTRLTNPPSKDTIPAPGDIIIELSGERHRLVTVEYATGELLLVVFTDSTSGSATPRIGRWLILPKPEGSTVRLDFNRAIVPNHVFSDLFPCPLPPAGNHLPLRVEAGERGPVHADE
ncbi:DUF1684 domain-containing protein [Kibdelosporangium aridum]|uniref:DUF1684 domain-containing protein n=1 Tax=Kibdelosporangium aridum TaxID=2030 RepID=UPI0005271C6E